MEFSDFDSVFREISESPKPTDDYAAAAWEVRMGEAYQQFVKTDAYADFHDSLVRMREAFIEEMLTSETGKGYKEAVKVLTAILKYPSLRIEQGKESRRAIGELDE